MINSNKRIEIRLLRELLDYQDGVLYWKHRTAQTIDAPFETKRSSQSRPVETRVKAWNNRLADKKAFTTVNHKGYHTGSIYDRTYSAHIVIWALHHGHWPNGDIDHKDGNRSNNVISNLQEATNQQNSKNRAMSSRNTSGITGVSYAKDRGRWRSIIHDNDGNRVDLGSFVLKERAIAVRKAAELKYGYTERHGVELGAY